MAGLTAGQIIERIANARGTDPAAMRLQIEQALRNIMADTAQPHGFMLAELFQGRSPTVGELVIALEQELYHTLMPKLYGWEWDGEGYRNISFYGNKH